MSEWETRIAELGLTLYGPHLPHDPLEAVVIHAGTARTSGQLPRIDGRLTCVGTLGFDVTSGVAALPRRGAVEIEVIVALRDGL
jgi:hypothetical protein